MLQHQDCEIRDRLVERGETLFNAPQQPIQFTKSAPADALLNNLEEFPHAFVLACLMDQQVKAERAWLIHCQNADYVLTFNTLCPNCLKTYILDMRMTATQKSTFPEVERLIQQHRAIAGGQMMKVDGINLCLSPLVFSPHLTNTSTFFVRNIHASDFSKFLDIGVGTGIVLLSVAKKYRSVRLYGVDQNPHATELTNHNLSLHGLSASIYTGDIFDCITDQTFDFIAFNPPLLKIAAGRPLSHLEASVFDSDKTTERFVQGVAKYMHTHTIGFVLATNRQNTNSSRRSERMEQMLTESRFWYQPIAFLDAQYEVYSVYSFRKFRRTEQ